MKNKYYNEKEINIEKFLDYVIIVEGKKDLSSLKALGFTKLYTIHETSVPIKERVLAISNHLDKKDRVCILTDFDKKGKHLYLLLKTLFQEQGVRLDSTLRGVLLKAHISHIEGLYHYLQKTI